MKPNKIIIAIFIFMYTISISNANVHILDLENSIAIAKMKSYQMLGLKQDLKIAEYNLRSATSRLRTNVSMDLNIPNYTETIREFEDSTGITFYSVRQARYSSALTVNQPLPTDGRIYITTGMASTDDLNYNERLMRVNTRLGLTQPIDALYGYNNIRSALKSAELAYEQSQRRLKREELNLVYSVSNSFYRLLSVQRRQELAQMNLDRQREAYEIAKNKYDAGLIREVDALQMEVDLAAAQNNYDLALLDQESALNSFKELIGIGLDDDVVISSEMSYEEIVVDVNSAVELALQNRSEVREREIFIEMNKLNLQRQRAAGMIRGNLNAYYEKIGVDRASNDFALNDAVSRSFSDFQDRPGNFGIGLSIHIPIIDWGENKAQVQAAEARLQQNMYEKEQVLRTIETEVKNLVANLSSSLRRLQLLEKNVLVAEQSFEITRARFADGDIDSQSLALERERLNSAYTSHLDAYIQYELNLADLMRKTLYDYKNNQPVI